MKLLINKMLKNNFSSNLRNLLNIKPIHMSLEGLAGSSVSDAFAWRTDNGFVTKFKSVSYTHLTLPTTPYV